MSKQNPNIIKKTEDRELVLTAAEDCVELAGRQKDGAVYGVTLRGRVLEIWKEEGGVRRIAASEELPEGEAERVRKDMLRVRNFTSFSTLAFYLLYVRKKLMRGAHAGSRL